MEYELKLDASDLQIIPADEVQEILQNVLMILLTPKFSVPLDRALGINAEFIDAPINQQARLTAEVATAIRTFEPRARLRKINFSGETVNGQIISSVVVEIVGR